MKRKEIRENVGSNSHKGVYRHRSKWQAKINIFGKRVNLGCFKDRDEAAKNYDFYMLKTYGTDFYLNFPNEDYSNFVPKLDIFSPKKLKQSSEKRKNWGRKLNKIKARQIRAKHRNQKFSIRQLAQEYEVTFATISRILHNITYPDRDFSKVYVIHNPKVN